MRGVSPQEDDFALLPPHWNIDGPAMANPHIAKAMHMNYKNIIGAHSSTMQGPLLLYLAAIMFHADWCQKHPILKNIPVLTDKTLLAELKKLVTIEPNQSVPCAYGVPSFVQTNNLV